MNKNSVGTNGRHDGNWGELRHVVVDHVDFTTKGDGKGEVGVAEQNSASSAGPTTMSINNSIAGSSLSLGGHSRSSTSSRFTKPSCIKKLNKKHLFGLALLMMVDLIWVGSAGLTKVSSIMHLTCTMEVFIVIVIMYFTLLRLIIRSY